jgi:hypothetical protein
MIQILREGEGKLEGELKGKTVGEIKGECNGQQGEDEGKAHSATPPFQTPLEADGKVDSRGVGGKLGRAAHRAMHWGLLRGFLLVHAGDVLFGQQGLFVRLGTVVHVVGIVICLPPPGCHTGGKPSCRAGGDNLILRTDFTCRAGHRIGGEILIVLRKFDHFGSGAVLCQNLIYGKVGIIWLLILSIGHGYLLLGK